MIRVYRNQEAASSAAADLFLRQCRQSLRERWQFTVALSGGRTPQAMYRLLALPPRVEQMPWRDIQVFWGDERCVADDDERNNARMARQALLDRVAIPADHLHPIRCAGDPAAEAARYTELLKQHCSDPSHVLPVLDLVFLGLGEDGHTASLFPCSSAPLEHGRWVAAIPGDDRQPPRVTLTPTILNAARVVVFLVFGHSKARILQRVLEGPSDTLRLPAQSILPTQGSLIWLLDQQAASLLNQRTLQQKMADP